MLWKNEFSKFFQKGKGSLDFSYEKGGVGRTGVVVLRNTEVILSLIFILTNPFQVHLLQS